MPSKSFANDCWGSSVSSPDAAMVKVCLGLGTKGLVNDGEWSRSWPRKQHCLSVGNGKQTTISLVMAWCFVDPSKHPDPSQCGVCGWIATSYYVLLCSLLTRGIVPTRGLCLFNINRCCIWEFAETTAAVRSRLFWSGLVIFWSIWIRSSCLGVYYRLGLLFVLV